MRLQFLPFVRLHHLLEFLRKTLPPTDVFLELVEAERPHCQPDLQLPKLSPGGHLRESRFVVKLMTLEQTGTSATDRIKPVSMCHTAQTMKRN